MVPSVAELCRAWILPETRQNAHPMASLTDSQLEVLRRLQRGRSLYSCNGIPRFLEEIVLLSRLQLISISKSGDPSLTDDGAAYLRVTEEISGFARLDARTAQAVPSSLPMADTPDGPLHFSDVSPIAAGFFNEATGEAVPFSESRH